jgi:hypothetical protein
MTELRERVRAMPVERRRRFIEGLSPAEALSLLAEEDPCAFAERVFGVRLYPKTREYVEAVLLRHENVSVVGCHGSGKDYTMANVIIPLWMFVHRPAKCAILTPSHPQLSTILWFDLRNAVARAEANGFPLFPTAPLKTPYWEVGPESYVRGFSPDDELNLTGFHGANLLAVISEAHHVDQAQVDKMKTFGATVTVMTGNGYTSAGEFYDSHHDRADRWHAIKISAYDTPNLVEGRTVFPGMVTPEQVGEWADDWGEDSSMFKVAALGEFQEQSEDGVVPIAWLRDAVKREAPPPPATRVLNPPPTAIMAIDVARFGEDKTVAIRRDGDVARIELRVQGWDTQQVGGWALRYCREHPEGGMVIVDDDGIGGGVTDVVRHGLREFRNRWRLLAFHGGEKAREERRFVNRIAECWWRCREWLDPSKASEAVLPDDAPLVGQLADRRYSNDGRGRIKLEDKDDMKGRGRKSPDEADSLCMTFATEASVAGVGVWLGDEFAEKRGPRPAAAAVPAAAGVRLRARARHRYVDPGSGRRWEWREGDVLEVPEDVAALLLEAHAAKFERV